MKTFALVGYSLVSLVAVASSVVSCSGAGEKTPGTEEAAPEDVIDGGTQSAVLPTAATPAPTETSLDCAEAAEARSNSGCDFWPTVTPNPVWSVFDFAVVVANGNPDKEATITIERDGKTFATSTIPANGTGKFPLPWVRELKGQDYDVCTYSPLPDPSVIAAKGAYHLTSDVPVIVYQFNSLQYKSGPEEKWKDCPDVNTCSETPKPPGCFSFSNDASLLLPSSAWTTSYRVTGKPNDAVGTNALSTATLSITASTDATDVVIRATDEIQATVNNLPIAKAAPGTLVKFTLQAGDVASLRGSIDRQGDWSGSVVQSTHPVQVIFSIDCGYSPDSSVDACDHMEESVLPAESFGKHYFVNVPTAPTGAPLGHMVRLYGNQDGTKLTYAGTPPANAPTTLNASEVVELRGTGGAGLQDAFEVTGDKEFAVASFLLGNNALDPSNKDNRGDPSMTLLVAAEQYRSTYVFLAPNDYETTYVDIIAPADTTLTLDAQPVTSAGEPLSSGYSLYCVALAKDGQESHVLKATNPVGIQVVGYGEFVSYNYPGGANVTKIAEPLPVLLR